MQKSYTGKRSLSHKWQKHIQEIHYGKLRSMRPTIDISSPPKYLHLENRKKQEQQREGKKHLDRITEIERANRILLERMSNIMNSKNAFRRSSVKKSLNQEMRKQALVKIANDNKALLDRIRSKTPVYNSRQWEKEWKQTEKRIHNIGEFPEISSRPKVWFS